MAECRNRNGYVDFLRGLAIMMVVFGHTITKCNIQSENSFLFNLIWSLQMPLFFLISGYVSRYGKNILSGRELVLYIGKKTIAYLFPWAIWSFFIRGLLFQQKSFLNLKHLFWNMDDGYWFLFSLWSIVIFFTLSKFFAHKCLQKGNKSTLKFCFLTGLFYVLSMMLLGAIGLFVGFDFLCIKLTLYYMPFYFVGFIVGLFQDKMVNDKTHRICAVIVGVLGIVYFAIVLNINLFKVSGWQVLLRVAASFLGCIFLVHCCASIGNKLKAEKPSAGLRIVRWLGEHSLEIYLSHYLILGTIKVSNPKVIQNIDGLLMSLSVFVFILLSSSLVAWIINQNHILKFLIFGKLR